MPNDLSAILPIVVVSLWACALVLVAGLLAAPLAVVYIQRRGIGRGEYYTLLMFSVAGMMLMAVAADLVIVFLALDLPSIPLSALAAFPWPRPESEESGVKYFLLGAFASAFLVYGTALAYGTTGSTNLRAILEALQRGRAGPRMLAVASSLLLVGLGFKVAAVPFHMWTPDVYHGAPTSAVAFMAVGAKAAGFAVLLRLLLVGFPIAAAGSAQGAAPTAVSAALFYLLAYGVTTIGAWAVVLTLEHSDGSGTSLSDYAGLARRRPGGALAMTICMLSLIGGP